MFFKDVSRIYEGSFEGVYRKFGRFKEVLRVCEGSSLLLKGSFKGVSRKFHGYFKED